MEKPKTAEQHLNKAINGSFDDDDWRQSDLGQFSAIQAMRTYARQALEAYRDECHRQATEMHVDNILLINIDDYLK